jgi:predicted amidohydrolase YtcJ
MAAFKLSPSCVFSFLFVCVLVQVGLSDSQTLGSRQADQLYRDGTLRGDLVLYNGKIHTMDAGSRVASVVAIKDGKILYVGENHQDAINGFESQPRAIDLGGRVAFPGLIDSHNHIVLMGNRPGYHTPLENAYSVADVLETYKARAKGVPKGAFITTIGGFHPN